MDAEIKRLRSLLEQIRRRGKGMAEIERDIGNYLDLASNLYGAYKGFQDGGNQIAEKEDLDTFAQKFYEDYPAKEEAAMGTGEEEVAEKARLIGDRIISGANNDYNLYRNIKG